MGGNKNLSERILCLQIVLTPLNQQVQGLSLCVPTKQTDDMILKSLSGLVCAAAVIAKGSKEVPTCGPVGRSDVSRRGDRPAHNSIHPAVCLPER
jgi:hypothetical protein